MEFQSKILITNSTQKSKIVILEPWGEEIQMPPKKTFELIAFASQEGNFEIDFGEDEITAFLWAGSTVIVFCEGKEMGVTDRLVVPENFPGGQNISSFIRFMFGKK